jgi:site-specific DNA recombinase
MKRVMSYARVSSQRQFERDLSIPDQQASMRRHAEVKGWEIVGEYEEGMSATNDRRPVFQRMIEDALSGQADLILVHSISRFSREHFLFEMYRRKLEAKGIGLASVSEDFGESESALLMQQFIALMAEWQSRENGKHVTRTRLANARQGNFNGGTPPFGYTPVGDERKRLQIDPEQAEIVRLIFRLRVDGDGTSGPIGIVEIAGWLNSRGYTCRKGRRFHTSTIHRILSDEIVIGRHWTQKRVHKTKRMRPKSEWLLTEVEPIISQELFAKAQALLASSRPSVTAPRFQRSNVLLGGLCKCGTCGSSMGIATGTGRNKVVHQYYVCLAYTETGKGSCPNPARIRREVLEELVLKALMDELFKPAQIAEIVRRVCKMRDGSAETEKSGLKQLKKNRGRISGQLSNLIRAIADGKLAPSEQVRSYQEQIETELQKIDVLIEVKQGIVEQRLSPISLDDAASACKQFRAKLKGAPIQLKRRYVRAFVERIEVSLAGVSLKGSIDILADASRSPEAANDISAPEVQSSIRKWRSGRFP